MLKPRVVPCLLLSNGGLIKTVGFKPSKYIGDPLNAVRIFNEKEVDELMILDIEATRDGRPPNYKLIASLAAECRMPLAYGGGVAKVEHFEELVSLGVEKVAVCSSLGSTPEIVSEAAARVGCQSVVAVIDVKKTGRTWTSFTHNGTRETRKTAVEMCQYAQDLGAGEIVLNSMDRDGQMKGYDLELVRLATSVVKTPLTVLGGAGSIEDIECLVKEFGIIGAAAGSLFVFKGSFRAVLISYLSSSDRDRLAALTANLP
jgi:cyclase